MPTETIRFLPRGSGRIPNMLRERRSAWPSIGRALVRFVIHTALPFAAGALAAWAVR